MTERVAAHEDGEDGAVEECKLEPLHSVQASKRPVLSATIRHADDLLVAAHADAAARAARAAIEMDAAIAAMHDDPANELATTAELHAVAFEDAVAKVEAILRCAATQHSACAAEPTKRAAEVLGGRDGGAFLQRLRNSGELRRDVEEDVEAARRFGHDAMLCCALAQAMQEKMEPRLKNHARRKAALGAGPATLLLSAVLSGDSAVTRSRREVFSEHRERTRQLMLQ